MPDILDYGSITEKYPWLIERGLKCVISPDADGMLCGLFMSHYLGWEVVGYYDNGKNLILKNGLKAGDCIFLDTEIYRPNIKSVGHHISLYRQNNTAINMDNYQKCLNPNNLRGRTLKENFSLKYPMGTIHLLMCIVGRNHPIQYLDDSFFVILQADGAINRFLDKYSNNLRDWLVYLGIDNPGNILNKVISKETNLIKLNKEYVEYVNRYVKGKKDKIPISDKGNLVPTSFNQNRSSFSEACVRSTNEYLQFLADNTGWTYDSSRWCFSDFHLYEFTKRIVRPGIGTFNAAVNENFLSLAMTKTTSMEYTVETPNSLP